MWSVCQPLKACELVFPASVCREAYFYWEIAYPCERADLPLIHSATLGPAPPSITTPSRCPICSIQGSLRFLYHSPASPKSEEVLKGRVSLNFKTDLNFVPKNMPNMLAFRIILNSPYFSCLYSSCLLHQLYFGALWVCILSLEMRNNSSALSTLCRYVLLRVDALGHRHPKPSLQFTARWDSVSCKDVSGATEHLQTLLFGEENADHVRDNQLSYHCWQSCKIGRTLYNS